MIIPFIALLVSLCVAVLLVRTQHLHARLSVDAADGGPQKFHVGPTPRIGGVPVMLGFLAGLALAAWKGVSPELAFWRWLICILPVFAAGLLEDMTKRVRPLWRLLAAFVSAALAWQLLNATIVRSGLPLLDGWLVWWPLSLSVTLIAVGGVAHAINIIDGYNGLAGMVSLMILGALGIVFLAVGDQSLLFVCLAMMGATAGFLLLNYPRGLIFAGDGGAYLWGFVLATLAVLAVARHHEVSPWFPLLLLIYPVWETLFSIYRKKILRKMSPGLPDGLHLHHLIFYRLARWLVGRQEARHLMRRNSRTSPYLWGLAALSVAPSMLFWRSDLALILCLLLFIVGYLWLYWRLIRFRAPRILLRRKR